jgi:DNA-binding response OmpR family regulator
VRRRLNRIAINLPVEVIAKGTTMRTVTQDLSPQGAFIRLSPPLPAGMAIKVAIAAAGQRIVLAGRVVHALTEVEARTLGRFPGIGIEFLEPAHPGEEMFSDEVQRVIERFAKRQPPADLRIVVADSQTRLLERLSTALGIAGFTVATATNGMEAIGACLSRTPDVVLVERFMPVVDGLHVLQEMGRHPQLAGVPVMMMASDATDLVRLQAFQLGAMDFIPKPFTVLEVILRARRWARQRQRDPAQVVLRGTLSELGLPSLLTMFEQDRKSGHLSIMHDHFVATIDFVDGRIIRARSSELDAGSHPVLMSLLDWKEGYFELTHAETPTQAEPEIQGSVTHLLLEHARLRDEASRH